MGNKNEKKRKQFLPDINDGVFLLSQTKLIIENNEFCLVTARFITRNTRKKLVRPLKNNKRIEAKAKAAVKSAESVEVAKEEAKPVKTDKEDTSMVDFNKVNDLADEMGLFDAENKEGKKVKRDKKERGILERADKRVVITEDNKQLLND